MVCTYSISLHLVGEDFDVEMFKALHGAAFGGRQTIRKSIVDRNVKLRNGGWLIEKRGLGIENVEQALLDLLNEHKEAVLNARKDFSFQIFISVVQDLYNFDEARGFYISERIVELLASIGASFDFDVSRVR